MVCFIYMLEVGRWTLQTVNSLLPLNFVFSVSFQRLTFGMSPFLPETAMPFPELAIDNSCEKRELFNKHKRSRGWGQNHCTMHTLTLMTQVNEWMKYLMWKK